jgi:hypothetical protein
MKRANSSRNASPLLAFLGMVVVIVALHAFVGCMTVAPDPVRDRVIRFDGNEQNAGFVGYLTNHQGGVITANARARYNALVEDYRARFKPPLARDAGVAPFTNGTFTITKEALVNFATMAQWERAKP